MWGLQTNNVETFNYKISPGETSTKPKPTDEVKPAYSIDLVFKVWAPNLNRVSHRLFLLGSLKQLGAWDVQNAVPTFPTEDEHTWKAEVRGIPMNSKFEWVWATAKHNKTGVTWESTTKRARTMESFGGVIHTIYGDGEEVFIQSATYVEVSTYRKVEDHQCLVLTGCAQTVGCWDLNRALKATEQPKGSGYWKCQLAFDSSSCLQFKWAIINVKDGQLHIMEKENHLLCGRRCWLRAVAPWNTTKVFVEDAPICLDSPDQVTGRTDVLVNTKKTRLDAIRKWLQKDSASKLSTLLPINQVVAPHMARRRTRNTPTKTEIGQARKSLQRIMYQAPPISKPAADSSNAATATTSQVVKTIPEKDQKVAENIKIQDVKPSDRISSIKGKGQTLVSKTSSTTTPDHTSTQETGDSMFGYLSDTLTSFKKWDFYDTSLVDLVKNAVTDFGLFKRSDDGDNKHRPAENAAISKCCSKADVNDDSGVDSWSQLTQTPDDSRADLYRDKKVDQDDFNDSIQTYYNYNHDYQNNISDAMTKYYDAEFGKDLLSVQGDCLVVKNEDFYCHQSDKSHNTSDFENVLEEQYLDMVSKQVSEEESIADEISRYHHDNIYTQSINELDFSDEYRYDNVIDYENDEVTKLYEEEFEDNYADNIESLLDLEMPDNNELGKRMIARKMEEEWGKTQKQSWCNPSKDSLLYSLDLSASVSTQSLISCHSASMGDGWMCPEVAHRNDVVPYSKTELEDVIIPIPLPVDRRSIARLMEEKWGRQCKQMRENIF